MGVPAVLFKLHCICGPSTVRKVSILTALQNAIKNQSQEYEKSLNVLLTGVDPNAGYKGSPDTFFSRMRLPVVAMSSVPL